MKFAEIIKVWKIHERENGFDVVYLTDAGTIIKYYETDEEFVTEYQGRFVAYKN